MRGEIAYQQSLLVNQSHAVSQVQNLIGQLQDQNVANFQNQISLVLPATESVPQALGQYQAIAQANGLTLQSANLNYLAVKPAASNSNLAKGAGTERFQLKVFGPYAAMKTFFQNLETNVRLTDLVSFKIIHSGAQPNQDLYTTDIVVDTYYQTQ